MAVWKRLLQWTLVGVGGLLLLAVLGGVIYQRASEARDLARYPAPGRMVEVDGHRMHLDCRGEGSPTVVVELGVGAIASSWDEMHRRMARETRVCFYDRPGLGYSEPADYSARAPEIAALLGKLLRSAGIEDDLLLVGWSAGGVYVRELYRQQPARIQAMLLLDSSHEQQAIRYPPPLEPGGDSALAMAKKLAPFGLVRLSGAVRHRFESFRGPDELRQRLVALYEQSHVFGAMLRESEAFELDIHGNPPEALGDLPLIVISAGRPDEESGGDSIAEREYEQRRREVKEELQRELAALSTRGKLVIATDSGHGIHTDQPELVIESLRELLQIARDDATATQGR